jgi:hypothetical protein
MNVVHAFLIPLLYIRGNFHIYMKKSDRSLGKNKGKGAGHGD